MNECIVKIVSAISCWIIKRDVLDVPHSPSYSDAEFLYKFIKKNYSIIQERDGQMPCDDVSLGWIVQKRKGEKPRNLDVKDIKDIYYTIGEKILYDMFFVNDKMNEKKYDYLSYNVDYFKHKLRRDAEETLCSESAIENEWSGFL